MQLRPCLNFILKLIFVFYTDILTTNKYQVSFNEIQKSIRVLCFVETCSKNLARKAQAIKDTWAKRCDETIFISDENNTSFPTLAPPGVHAGYKALWSKTVSTFRYLHQNYLNDFDWFMKTDDDTYVLVENLKIFLANHNPDVPHYFGKHYKPYGGYTSGGAGYVLSRQSLIMLESLIQKETSSKTRRKKCKATMVNGVEDVLMGKRDNISWCILIM